MVINIHKIYLPFQLYFRKRRLYLFYKFFRITGEKEIKILDVGGNIFFWKLAERERLPVPSITILNILPPSKKEVKECERLGIKWVVADGRNMPFSDNSFDIVFSNSVIEHLGDKNSQEQFAKEIRRVGKAYWVQTPNKMFLIEPHLITPFVHWFLHLLPKRLQKIVLRYSTVWGLLTKPSKEQCENFLNEVRLLSFKEMKELFPDANIICERFFGLKKSLIAVKLSDER